MRKLLVTFVVVGIILAAAAAYFFPRSIKPSKQTTITNYEECVAAGYPALESYPSRCVTPDGKSFTQDIGNELEKTDLITIETPRPGSKITSPLRIAGKARGTWFFEATFPVKLMDDKGNIIAENYAQAQGEWMTEEFVVYESKLIFPSAEGQTKSGKLILERSNPSGLPENADQLEIPVKF